MPRSKKTETVVVRPIKRGADSPRKTVLAPLKELNRHAPLVSSPICAPRLSTLPLPPGTPLPPPPPGPPILSPLPHMPALQFPTMGTSADVAARPVQHELAPIFINNDPRPWHRQSRSPPKQSRWRSMPSTRTVGRTIGNEWVSADYVCGSAIEPEWGYEADAQEEREREWCEERQHPADEEGGRARAEVHIMDIAKPAKRRGASLLFRG
ncbi:hypothetical protein BD309DRAFT_961676 [Dichomitus squalens]|nr:hypothetical protein BD309DRAFT_961676 [Dichomitus squalens]